MNDERTIPSRPSQHDQDNGRIIYESDSTVVYADGKGRLHRQGGPAVVENCDRSDSMTSQWYTHDELDREDGPAHYCNYEPIETASWYRKGRQLDPRETAVAMLVYNHFIEAAGEWDDHPFDEGWNQLALKIMGGDQEKATAEVQRIIALKEQEVDLQMQGTHMPDNEQGSDRETKRAMLSYLTGRYQRQFHCAPDEVPASLETLCWVLGNHSKDGAERVKSAARAHVQGREAVREAFDRHPLHLKTIIEIWTSESQETGEPEHESELEAGTVCNAEALTKEIQDSFDHSPTPPRLITHYDDPYLLKRGYTNNLGMRLDSQIHLTHSDGRPLTVSDWSDVLSLAGKSLHDVGITDTPAVARQEVDHER